MVSKEIKIISERIKSLENDLNNYKLKLNQLSEIQRSLEVEYIKTKGAFDEYNNILKVLNEEVGDDSEHSIEEESVNIKKSNSGDIE